jgi:hypothetical protein
MTIIEKIAKTIWEECKPYVKYAYTFNKDSDHSKIISSKIKGIYIFTHINCEPSHGNVIYVGETYGKAKYEGISSRIRSHKKSLRNPDWKNELTGKKFLQYNIPLDIEMGLWYIESCDIGINDKQSSIAIEQLIQKYIKPKLWSIE